MSKPRTDDRADFLAGVLTTAIEGGINYWASVSNYRWGFYDLGTSSGGELIDGTQPYAFATIHDNEDSDAEPVEVSIETIAKGLGLLRAGEVRYVGDDMRKNILLADRTNGDEGDIDAGDADVILQLGMFGEVIYG